MILPQKRPNLAQNWLFWPNIGIFGPFGPMADQKTMRTRCLGCFSVTWEPKLLLPPVRIRIFAGWCGALLVGWLVVVARGLYLARHLFTFSKNLEYKKVLQSGSNITVVAVDQWPSFRLPRGQWLLENKVQLHFCKSTSQQQYCCLVATANLRTQPGRVN